ncbi:hypothetical protein Tco_0066650 [Tanacetum coccineum]
MHGHGHTNLAKNLNDKILKTVDEMFERVGAFIRGEMATGSAEIVRPFQGDKGNTRPIWYGGQEKAINMNEPREVRRNVGVYMPYPIRDTFTPLLKTPKEILTMEGISFPKLPPLIRIPKKQNLNKFCDYHGDRGHNTNDCYQLKKQIDEVVATGKLTHLVHLKISRAQTQQRSSNYTSETQYTRKDNESNSKVKIRVPYDHRNNPPQHPRIVYPSILDISYFCHFLDILQNYDPIDDEPMWAADHVVALTPGSSVTIPEIVNEFAIKGSSNTDTDKIMAQMDAMIIKMDAQYKELQSHANQPTPDLNDDDIPMSCEEEAKFMQTFRKTYFYNDYRDRDSNRDKWHSSGWNYYNRDNYQSNTDDKLNTQPNPRGGNSKAYQPPQARNDHVNVVFTRSGKTYKPPDNMDGQQNNSENPINFNSDDEDDESTPQPKTQPTKLVKETPLPKPYKPKILYPQRLRKEKMEAQYGKFLDMI